MFTDINPHIYFKPVSVSFQNAHRHVFFQRPKLDEFIKTVENNKTAILTDFEGSVVSCKSFGKIKNNTQDTYLYTITNKNGASVDLSTFGASIVSIKVPDKNGNLVDVVQGYDNVTPYELYPVGHAGGTIGPVANKIDNGKFSIDGKTYHLETNKDNGRTHCHGGSKGFDVQNWTPKVLSDGVEFTYYKKDMENGYPGNVTAKVIYKFDNNNNLHIKYTVTTDKDTLVNLTNHSYFNLDGAENTEENAVYNHSVTLPNSSFITENNNISIPTGKFINVKNTPFDFSKPVKIGDVINENSEQLKIGSGFDHNFVIDGYDGRTLIDAALIKSSKTGIKLKVSTNLPGFQFYTSNHLGKKSQPAGKSGSRYEKRSALCIEPQFFPNAINTKEFEEKGILRKGQTYEREIIYSFSN